MSFQTKFNRNYVLVIKPFDSPTIVITRPLTIDFDISRNDFSQANYAKIRIYNLSQRHRNLIRHDVTDSNAFRPLDIALYAGYGDGPTYPLIFSGNAQAAYSKREGTNFITTIDGFDGGAAIQNAVTNLNIAAGMSWQSVIESTLSDLSPFGVGIGAVAPFPGIVSRGFGLSGPTVDVIDQLTNSSFFIDSKLANVLPKGYAIGQGPSLVVNSQTGLLNTPSVQQSIIDIELLFEPRLSIGTTIELESITAQAYNGTHQVVGITHRGTISEVVAGDCVTSVRALGGVFQGIISPFIR